MARRARRTFTPEFKAKVVLDALTGAASQAEVCREHRISPTPFGPWEATLLDRLSSVFRTDEARSAEAARIAERERLAGQQALELAALKKASTWRGGATTGGGTS
jgi:transposase